MEREVEEVETTKLDLYDGFRFSKISDSKTAHTPLVSGSYVSMRIWKQYLVGVKMRIWLCRVVHQWPEMTPKPVFCSFW